MADNGKGALFKEQQKKSERAPDWTGSIEVTVDLLEAWLKEAKAGGSPYKIRLGAWMKDGPRGKFFSLSANAPYHKAGAGAPTPNTNRQPSSDDPPW